MTTSVQLQSKAPIHMPMAGERPAVIAPAPLIGTWVNTNKATNDLEKIIITAAGGGITVQVFGACKPTPCPWGSVPGFIYAANVSSNKVVAFCADYRFGFGAATVLGHLQGQYLEVEVFTEFTDGSGRSNLYTTDQMVK
jgi:hypothetical protein